MEASVLLYNAGLKIPIINELGGEAIENICPTYPSAEALYPQNRLPALTWIGCCFLISGSLFRSWAQTTCAQFFTWELAIRPGHKLCTRGPYSYVRHPSYTGLYVLSTGHLLVVLSRHTFLSECISKKLLLSYYAFYIVVISLAAIVYASFAQRSAREDKMLKKEFGKQWEDWASRTKYQLFPGVR